MSDGPAELAIVILNRRGREPSVTQHSSLSPARWATFPLDQQVLMIGNEMHRAGKLMTRPITTARSQPT